ncbi:MAG: hypothetical protein JWM38_836 [Sphingomonas bacterium]|nr:hypothetical protein [Sphingomonas bacterium]MDB5717409.1 hypothetical protein [Sphingomonas bacterium]
MAVTYFIGGAARGLKRRAMLGAIGASCMLALVAAPAAAQNRPDRKLTPQELDQLQHKHEGYYGALAPQNLAKPRPKPPFDLTGTWFVDLSEGFSKFMFGPPYPEFLAPGQEAMKGAAEARAAGKTYRDAIGQCYPAGLPMIMTRVWPIAFIQLPTAIYMVAGFTNSLRIIYLDGRDYSDPDTVISSYNGESIGHWEGDTLVVKSKYFETDHHYIDQGIPISDKFEVTERIKMINGGKTLEIEYIMTDPEVWKGEWRNTKRWDRQDYSDINEVECIAANNAHLPGTDRGEAAAEPAKK